VTAPSVGVFLDAHPLRSAPFVQPGELVVQGQFIGLLKIGALLLPVRAPCAGTVGTTCIASGTTVGYGRPLRSIRPHSAA
jgi:acetyl-CoA carboxylase biotin carboxyl carrier protein